MATENRKKSLQKVLKGIIIAIFIFITLSTVATRFIYDFIFKGYDGKESTTSKTELISPYKEEHYYACGEETLYGYRLKTANATDSLVVIAPGFNACADEYLPQANYFVAAGYDVFLFDCVGSGNSSGDSYIGFPQEINDLNATLRFIKKYKYKNVFLFGHSRGGYATCCVLNGDVPITAAATVSGVNSAMDGIMSSSVNAVGKFAYINYPFLWMYQNELFGYDLANMNAATELSRTKTPVLIIHGENDTDIPKDKYSIYSYKNRLRKSNLNFVLYKKDGHDGHTSILFDEENIANIELMNEIDTFFKSHISKGEA